MPTDSEHRSVGRWRSIFPATVWFVFILVLLSLPGTSFPDIRLWKPDKIAHLLLFGVQAFLVWIALELPYRIPRSSTASIIWAASITMVYGISSEIYQEVATTRMADIYDVLANAIGILVFIVAVHIIPPARLLRLARFFLRFPENEKD